MSGRVEVDETAIGGKKSGKRGSGAAGKTEVALAVELKDPKGFDRVRFRVLPDTTKETLAVFLEEVVEPGSAIFTDGFSSYRPGHHEASTPTNPRTRLRAHRSPTSCSPAFTAWASLLKRWILGTFQ